MVSSHAELDHRLRNVHDALYLVETEETWDKIAGAIGTFQSVLQEAGAVEPEYFTNALRAYASPLNACVNSERSRLSGAAINLISSAATELNQSFDALLSLFLPTLLGLCGRPNKIFVTRARTCLVVIIEATQSPQILTYLLRYSKDKSTSLRLAVAESALACLERFNPPDLQKDARGQEIEALIKSTAKDANADIRRVGRKIFEAYSILLPNRVNRFVAPLTPTMKKYLAAGTRPASSAPPNPPSRPSSSLSTRSTLASSQSSSLAAESKSASRSNTRSVPTSARPMTTSAEGTAKQGADVAAPSRAPSRQAGGVERPVVVPRRPESRTESTRKAAEAMPPPVIVPSRPRHEGALRVQDLAPIASSSHLSTSSDTSRPKAGPLRPTALHQQPASAPSRALEGQSDQKRPAGGPRRVLRPEPSASSSDSTGIQPAKEEQKYDSSRNQTVPARRAEDVEQPRPSSVQEKRVREKDPVSIPSSRATAKAPARQTSVAARAEGTSKLPSKPIAAHEARPLKVVPKPATQERLPFSRTIPRSHVPSKAQNQLRSASQGKPSNVKSKAGTGSAIKPNTKAPNPPRTTTSPHIPLPHSPAQSRPQTPHEEPSCNEHDSPIEQDETDDEETSEPTVMLDPTTPQAQSRARQWKLVEQTPISALVESIQRGFAFASSTQPLSTVDEGPFEESSMVLEEALSHTKPVTWNCKPLALSKSSS